MRRVTNPTTYFFAQANDPPALYKDQIDGFVSKLLNLEQCQICMNKFDLTQKLPRILIHCGHTVCTCCLTKFFRNRRVRCPLCLKLVKHLDTVEKLPINHTIFYKLVEQHNVINKGQQIDPQMYLYQNFENNSMATKKNDQQNIDPETGLEYCKLHNDRVKHFYCMNNNKVGCRPCMEVILQKNPQAMIVDLYEIENIPEFLQQAQHQYEGKNKGKQQMHNGEMEENLIIQTPGNLQNLLGNEDDDQFEDEEYEENSLKSV